MSKVLFAKTKSYSQMSRMLMSWAITNTRKEMIIRSLLYSQMDVMIKRMAITILNHQEVEAGHVE